MSKREKIILSAMAVTMLLGAYLYFDPGALVGRRGVEIRSDAWTRDFVQQVVKTFKEDTNLARELFAIRRAEREWGKDPFLKGEALLSDTRRANDPDRAPAGAASRPDLAYTGFLEVGNRRLAIIGGMEYASGETIDGRGYYVRRIQPHQVEIGKRNAADTIILKLTEFEAGMGK